MVTRKLFIIFYSLFYLVSCSYKPTKQIDKLILTRTSFYEIDDWDRDNHLEALQAFKKSCTKIKQHKKDFMYNKEFAGHTSYWKEICIKLDKSNIKTDKTAKRFFEHYFTPFLVKNNEQTRGRFTGYHEMELRGSKKYSAKYPYPIYREPKNLHKIKHKLTRKAIHNGALKKQNLEILYVSDDVRLFFMHIQGSGRIILPNGEKIRVGYKAQNGHPYYPIGKYLIDNNHVDKKSMNAYSIQDWLYGNPHKSDCVMNLNPSYVFFHEIKEDGAIGGQGVILTPKRSIAVDKNYFPYGVPFWIDTIYPEQDMRGNKYFRRLMIAQDTGGAIRSPIRADIFFGVGRAAEDLASNMNHFGSYYILLPKKYAENKDKIVG